MPPLGQLYPQLNDVELPDAIPYSQVRDRREAEADLGVQDVVDRDHTGGIPFKAVLELAKAYVAHYEGDHKRAWKFAKPLTSDEYLSRYRQDHFAQLEKALKGVRWRRLVLRAVPVKKVTGRA
jgi:hypothetical protein